MQYTLRNYQANAVDAGVELVKSPEPKNGVIVLPTGAGKSLVIGSIADAINEPGLILQPSKEILEQNFQKLMAIGRNDLGIYSASLSSKAIRPITLATIGSIYKKPELFSQFKYIAVDECDLVNAKEGMYQSFFEAVGKPVLGFTASPWRMYPGNKIGTKRVRGGKMIDVYSGNINKIITRTRPRVFHDLIHITQIRELYDQGYLCPIEYVEGFFDQSQLALNTTGNDYTEATYKRISSHIVNDAVAAVRRSSANSHLIFTKFITEAEQIVALLENTGIPAAIVTGDTHPDERERILSGLKSGKIKAVANVGVLTVGFDYPALDHIVLARPTNSARLYYQMLGRGIRIHPSKTKCVLTDLCGNVDRLGKIEDWIIADNDGDKKYRLKSGEKFLTGIDMKSGMDLEKDGNNSGQKDMTLIHFGKYKGQRMSDVPADYLDWIIKNFSPGAFRNQAADELSRRAVANV